MRWIYVARGSNARQTTDDDAMDALGWARAFDDSDAEGESEVEEDDGVVVVDRSAVDLGGGSRASTRETAPREDGARRWTARASRAACAWDGWDRNSESCARRRASRESITPWSTIIVCTARRRRGGERRAGVRRGVRMCTDLGVESARRVTFVDKRRRTRRRRVSADFGVARLRADEGEACGVGGVWRCAWGRI